jgi:hypothetical protein
VLATLTDESARIAAPVPVGASLFVPSIRAVPSAPSTVQGSTVEGLGAQVATMQLSGAQLSGMQLSDVQLSGARVSDVQVSGARVSDVQVSGARVSDVQVSGARNAGPREVGAGAAGRGPSPLDGGHPPVPSLPPPAFPQEVPARGHRRPGLRKVLPLAGAATVGLVVGWFLGAGALAGSTTSSGPPVLPPGPSGSAGMALSTAGMGAAAAGTGAAAAGTGAAAAGTGAAAAGTTCSAHYRVVEQWPGGFKGQVTVTAGETPLHGWRLAWSFGPNQAITQWWNVAVTNGGRTVLAENSAANGTVPARGATTFVFLGTYRTANPPPQVTCTPG